MGLYVIVKGIASSFLAVYDCLKISGDISLALNKLVSVSDLGFFRFSNVFFQFFKAFFIFNNETIFLLQVRMVYLLNNARGGLM